MKKMKFEKDAAAIFAAGLLIGKCGKAVLGSKKAKKLYVKATVLGLEAKDAINQTKTAIVENAQDVYEEAMVVKAEAEAEVAAKKEAVIFEDCSPVEECTEETNK